MSYQQIIYNQLRKHGITKEGALGVLGNLDCESNCEPYRIQGDFSPYRTQSKAYVQSVMSGSVSKEQFCDGRVGKFIAQWTYPTRQAALWDFWKASGKPIDDAGMQADFVCKELQSDNPQLFAFLKQTTDIFTAVSRVCREYERPAVNNIDARYASAKRIQYEINLDGGGDEPEPTPEPPKVDHSLVLRTIDKNCSGWDETYLLQDILALRKYDVGNVDGEWNEKTQKAVVEFQKDFSLVPDGIVGSNTWNALFQR